MSNNTNLIAVTHEWLETGGIHPADAQVIRKLLAALEAADTAQVVPQPNRQATRQRMHEFMFSEAMTVVRALGYSQERYDEFLDGLAAAAVPPTPLTIDREAETELQECIEQEIELGGDAGSITAAVREFLARMSAQPVEGEVAFTPESILAASLHFASEEGQR